MVNFMNSSPGFSVLIDNAFLKVVDRKVSFAPSIDQATIFSEEEVHNLMAWLKNSMEASNVERVEHGRISVIGADTVITYSH